ncbi:MAG: hypothetical protein PWR17_1238 [Candidatus Methanomethylophilaceae archaeon]|nr:hypothetical protein [Candidatus Methanomethylophilaceae archaeon]
MGIDAIPEICAQIGKIGEKEKEVDFLIVSQGGDPIVPWRIIGLLRDRFEKISVLIPYTAQSAATILAFGADEIVMHPYSCLGPIDAQITLPPSGQPSMTQQFSVEDIKSYVDFIGEDLKISNEDSGIESLKYLNEKLGPVTIGIVKRSMKLIDTLASKLLLLHMDDEEAVKKIVDNYNSLSGHGYTVSRREALESGLPVVYGSKDLEKLMWSIWTDIESEMKCKDPFYPSKLLNENKEVVEKIKEGVRKGIVVSETITEVVPVAIVESNRLSSSFKVYTNITASTVNTPNVMVSVDTVPVGWRQEC